MTKLYNKSAFASVIIRRLPTIFKIKLYDGAIKANQAVAHLNKLENLLPKYITKLSNKMITIVNSRIPKIKSCYKPLPTSQFKNDGSIVIKSVLFIRMINKLNHIINLNFKKNKIIQIQNNYKILLIWLSKVDQNSINNQVNKLKLINMITKDGQYAINHNDNTALAKSTINIISKCMVLNQEAYTDYFKINNEWKAAKAISN